MKKTLSLLDNLIVLSDYWRYLLGHELPGVEIKVINNAIGSEWLLEHRKNSEAKTEIQLENNGGNKARVLFMGSLGVRKGVFEILKAASIVARKKPEIQFILAGSEELKGEEHKLKTLYKEFGLEGIVKFPGALYGDEKIQAYRDADLLILPAYNEAFPMVILEAFGAGLPVITTPVGSIPERVGQSNAHFLRAAE